MIRRLAFLWILASTFLLSSCAAPVALHGALVPPAGTSRDARARMKLGDAVVWLDRASVSKQPRMGGPQDANTVLFSRPRSARRVVVMTAQSSARLENRDQVYHLPFIRTRKGTLSLGTSQPASFTPIHLPRSGTLLVFCELHSDEMVWIRVVPSHTYACADRVGRFTLPPVSNGSYVVRAWHPDLGETSLAIRIDGKRTPSVTLRFPTVARADRVAVGSDAPGPRARRIAPDTGFQRVARAKRPA